MAASVPAQAQEVELSAPRVVLDGVPFAVTIADPSGQLPAGERLTLGAGARTYEVASTGEAELTVEGVVVDADAELVLTNAAGETLATGAADAIPAWFAILPSLVAIGLALALRQVIPAMFLGLWLGAALVYTSIFGVWYGLLDIITVYALDALTDSGHGSIIIFSLMIGGMVGIIAKNGGTRGIVNLITRQASTPRHGQTATGVLGVAIFFDDYANALIVGNTMRPVTDKLRISREKLAYVVDSTAAPVATLALVSTWIGFQVGVIDMHLFYSAIAAVLAGAVWGDHCSPISDTTILSSLASGCDHIDHVRTQLPYAGLAGLVALSAGTLLVAYLYPWWIGMLVGLAVLAGWTWLVGRKAEAAEAAPLLPATPAQPAE